jgi:hypothetical protein
MMWPASKQARRAKLAKRRPKVAGWEVLGLGPSAKEQPGLPMEEIRRLAITLAGRGIGQHGRSGSGESTANSEQRPSTVRRTRTSAGRHNSSK